MNKFFTTVAATTLIVAGTLSPAFAGKKKFTDQIPQKVDLEVVITGDEGCANGATTDDCGLPVLATADCVQNEQDPECGVHPASEDWLNDPAFQESLKKIQ